MFPATTCMPQAKSSAQSNDICHMKRRIFNQKDVSYYVNNSVGFKNASRFVKLLTNHIKGTEKHILNSSYVMKHKLFLECDSLMQDLSKLCDETDVSKQNSTYLRFGHLSYRDWFDSMQEKVKAFIKFIVENHQSNRLANIDSKKLMIELEIYLTESFGNRTRLDYGTGHEFNFVLFLEGLLYLVDFDSNDGNSEKTHDNIKQFDHDKQNQTSHMIDDAGLTKYVKFYGWDILALLLHSYLRLCRKVQKKFRLEPAGSRGVYNMDDFQFLPFLFGASQLIGCKEIEACTFYDIDEVTKHKDDLVFFEAVQFIYDTKKGPFEEHSYTLWEYSSLGSWDAICRRIESKFVSEVLKPLPIIQHLLFGEYILIW